MADRAHLSIGEVLSLLQDEFPDITISKIRFLESQGLLDPERTPSGYRKFYEPDIERLRWILQQQRENFLPLRVIKDRLEVQGGDANGESAVAVAPAPAIVPVATEPETRTKAREEPEREVYEPPPRPVYEPPAPAEERPTARSARPFDPGVSAASLTGEELMAATGLSEKALAELERFGLVAGRAMGRDTIYDEEALTVGRLCAAFARFGVEPRHLRMYKVAAEREASFFEQVVLPLLKQRNPSARRQAVENLGELAALGDSLRAAMLRGALKGYTSLH